MAFLLCLAVSSPASAELAPGDRAPAFQLQGSDGRSYALEQFVGERGVVLAWFPKAFTPGCTQEACDFRDSHAPLEAAGYRIFGVSPDPVDKLAKSKPSTASAIRSSPTPTTKSPPSTAPGARRRTTAASTKASSARPSWSAPTARSSRRGTRPAPRRRP